MKLSAWLVFAGALVGGVRSDASQSDNGHRAYASAGWNIVESENFRFCCRGPLRLDAAVIRAAESLRCDLTARWLGQSTPAQWTPKCDVVLHTTEAAYLAAVPGGGRTLGSSLINLVEGRVSGRRIDLRADRPAWFGAALGHELTHVVLADKFPDGRLPAWADEGLAVLADSAVKQEAHRRDLHSAQSLRQTFRLVELLALEGYPAAERQAAFYGQSASLVRYLVARGTPDQFVSFIHAAGSDGYESAVREVYGLRGVHELERHWLQHLSVSGTLARN